MVNFLCSFIREITFSVAFCSRAKSRHWWQNWIEEKNRPWKKTIPISPSRNLGQIKRREICVRSNGFFGGLARKKKIQMVMRKCWSNFSGIDKRNSPKIKWFFSSGLHLFLSDLATSFYGDWIIVVKFVPDHQKKILHKRDRHMWFSEKGTRHSPPKKSFRKVRRRNLEVFPDMGTRVLE